MYIFCVHRSFRGCTLPPIIMEVENGVLEDVFSLQMGYSHLFSTSMIMGGRLCFPDCKTYPLLKPLCF